MRFPPGALLNTPTRMERDAAGAVFPPRSTV